MSVLAAADSVAAEFVPLYTQGLSLGHTRDEMRAMPVPMVAVVLDLPIAKGSRSIALPSDDSKPDAERRRTARPPRPRKKRETGKVFRGRDAV